MKLITLFITLFALALTAHADRTRLDKLDKAPLDKETVKAVAEYLETSARLGVDDSYSRLGKLYEGAMIYDVWLTLPAEKGSYTSSRISVLKYGDNIEIYSSASDAAIALLLKHRDKITSAEELRDLMTAITPVTEVKDMGDGLYHIYNGEDFFDEPSGYVVTVKDGKITDCKYKLKLEKED